MQETIINPDEPGGIRPDDRIANPNAFPASVECSTCKNEFGVTLPEFEAIGDVPCPVCVHGVTNPKASPYAGILRETVAALTETAATIQRIADLLAEGKKVEAGKLAYDFYGERYTPYHSCFRFPAARGFASAIDSIGNPYLDDCNQKGIQPETGEPYDVPGGNRPDGE